MLKAAGVDIDVLANKSLSFADRLKELTPIVNDNAAMTQLFGRGECCCRYCLGAER